MSEEDIEKIIELEIIGHYDNPFLYSFVESIYDDGYSVISYKGEDYIIEPDYCHEEGGFIYAYTVKIPARYKV